MSVSDIVAAGRALAEALMLDSCTIRRRIGTTIDPNTGREVAAYGPPIYTGPCRVRMMGASGADVHAPQEPATQDQLVVAVPAASTPAQADDILTITASTDAALQGRQLRVESFFGQTYSTQRRYVCEESTTPDTSGA